jgi:hypothetical protein
MTNPQNQARFPDEPNWDNLHSVQGREEVAELRDAMNNVLSRGKALLFPDNTHASFFPGDSVSLDAIESRAGVLFLTGEKQSLKISAKRCEQDVAHDLHFHLRISN